jgi:hypothetical protein
MSRRNYFYTITHKSVFPTHLKSEDGTPSHNVTQLVCLFNIITELSEHVECLQRFVYEDLSELYTKFCQNLFTPPEGVRKSKDLISTVDGGRLFPDSLAGKRQIRASHNLSP